MVIFRFRMPQTRTEAPPYDCHWFVVTVSEYVAASLQKRASRAQNFGKRNGGGKSFGMAFMTWLATWLAALRARRLACALLSAVPSLPALAQSDVDLQLV